MSIYKQEDDGTLTPVQVEQTVEELLKTREAACEASPCSKINLEILQAKTDVKVEPAPATTSSSSATSSGDKV